MNPFPWLPCSCQPRILFVIQWLSIVSINTVLTWVKKRMSVFEACFAVSYCCLISSTDFGETIMASTTRSRTRVALKILVLGFQVSTSTHSVFTAWKLSTVLLEVSRNKHCRMSVCWTLSTMIYDFCLLRKWSSVFFIKNRVILCSFSCRRDQVYSRAGAACVRTTTSPCRGMQVYKQLQKRFARSEGLSEGKAAWVS